MEKRNLISVIVPVYNVEKYLEKCVESILKQKYEYIEILLIDDGSNDKSAEICDDLLKKDERIRVLHKKNGGLSDARNEGIRISRGEWIVFVDSDDYIAPNMVMELYNAAKGSNSHLAICGVNFIDEKGKNVENSQECPIKNEVLNSQEIYDKLYKEGGWYYIIACNKLYHKDLLNKDFFPIGKLNEDEYVIAELIWKAKRIACIEKKEYYYVLRTGSIMQSKGDKRFLNLIDALRERFYFFEENGFHESAKMTRNIIFKRISNFYFDDNHEEGWKIKFKDGKKIYASLPGRSVNEHIKWFLFNISPKFERKVVESINH